MVPGYPTRLSCSVTGAGRVLVLPDRCPTGITIADPRRIRRNRAKRNAYMGISQISAVPKSSSLSQDLCQSRPYVVSVSSGKGGVGKTHIVINLAIEMQRRGLRVLVFDADLGLSSVPMLLGFAPEYNLSHVLMGSRTMNEVLLEGPEGIQIVPGSSGVQELTALTTEQQLRLICEAEELEDEFDVVLIDTCAGISSNVIFFNIASQDNIMVVYPEPASFVDAFAMMKVLAIQHHRKRFKLILNGATDEEEGRQILDRMVAVSQKSLQISVSCLGVIPQDIHIRKATRVQKAVVDLYPEAVSSRCFRKMASKLLESVPKDDFSGSLQLFWKRKTP